jgi:hypothetical protein
MQQNPRLANASFRQPLDAMKFCIAARLRGTHSAYHQLPRRRRATTCNTTAPAPNTAPSNETRPHPPVFHAYTATDDPSDPPKNIVPINNVLIRDRASGRSA